MAKLFVLFSLVALSARVSAGQNPICKQLANGPVRDIDLRAVLMFTSARYLVTREWLVYNVSPIDLAKPRLPLSEARSMEKEWAGLANKSAPNVKYFHEHRNELVAIYSLPMEDKSLIYFEFEKANGLLYNLRTGTLQLAGSSSSTDEALKEGMVISGLGSMYTIAEDQWHVLQLNKWSFKVDNRVVKWTRQKVYNMYYARQKTEGAGQGIAFSTKSRSKGSTVGEWTLDGNITDWNVPLIGFLQDDASKNVRLFDCSYVYQFREPQSDEAASSFTWLQAKDYFECPSRHEATPYQAMVTPSARCLRPRTTLRTTSQSSTTSRTSSSHSTFHNIETDETSKLSSSVTAKSHKWPIIIVSSVVFGCLAMLGLVYVVIKCQPKRRRKNKQTNTKTKPSKPVVEGAPKLLSTSKEKQSAIRQSSSKLQEDFKPYVPLKYSSNPVMAPKESNSVSSKFSNQAASVGSKQSCKSKISSAIQ